jgi:hypothetical protein
MKSFLNLQYRKRGENFYSFSFLRGLRASARELGGLKMLPKKTKLFRIAVQKKRFQKYFPVLLFHFRLFGVACGFKFFLSRIHAVGLGSAGVLARHLRRPAEGISAARGFTKM